MAGHSKWANTKHRKARRDKDRMGNFTKMLKSIEAAASKGKGPENYTLVSAVAEAKKQSVPSAKIQAAIDRGAGSTGGGGGTSVLYEGHAAGGRRDFGRYVHRQQEENRSEHAASFFQIRR